MKMEEILETFKSLGNSQGFYGRLYNNIMELKEENIEKYEELKEQLESKNFTDTLDLIMYIEE